MPVFKAIIAFVFISVNLLFSTDTETKLLRFIRDMPERENLAHGHWSIMIKNINTGKVIAEMNSGKSMVPASGLKLVPAAAALKLLGSDFRFNTDLQYDGNIETGILTGNVYLKGYGDPTLGSDQMPNAAALDSLMDILAAEISKAGISKITGNIIGDETYFDYHSTPDFWPWIHIGNYYGAGTSALSIHENLYYLYFKPGNYQGASAGVLRTEPELPQLEFFNEMRTGAAGSRDNGYIYAAPNQNFLHLRGTIPMGQSEFSIKGSIPDPASFAAFKLREKLTETGIAVEGIADNLKNQNSSTMSDRKTIYTHFSPPLKEIVFWLNKKSVNLYAEQLLKTIGKTSSGKGDADSGIKTIEQWMDSTGIDREGLFLMDGSGLSPNNGITTKTMCSLLEYMSRQPEFDDFYNSLAVAGDPQDIGYMKNMCKGTSAAGNLRAKTGSISRVRSHSGYVHNKQGDLLCFSMIANNFTGSQRAIDRLHEQIMILMAEL